MAGNKAGQEMDPDAALELVKHGSTLLLLDVPQYTLFGIDTQVPQRRFLLLICLLYRNFHQI